MAEVEVCGFKDCKRAGGGARLEKLITEILEEKGVEMEVNKCDCQVSLFKKQSTFMLVAKNSFCSYRASADTVPTS